jgi:hypothetical protein
MFRSGQSVELSFDGVTNVPSSFINGALISLLDEFNFDFIRNHLRIENSTWQINDVIRRCFGAAGKRTPPLESRCA